MPLIDTRVETEISHSTRAQQLSSAFDVPAEDHHELHWRIDAPWEDRDWSIGLIVGPSGAGKTTVLRAAFGDPPVFDWDGASVIDTFGPSHSVDDIAKACSAVGFNTIPAWLRPYHVLSNGEQFRVGLARLMLDAPADGILAVDEFTSVVDRQVAKIGANAVQKWVRRSGRQFVASTCHYDVNDWLQPDWVLDVAARSFTWRSLQPRPAIDVTIRKVDYAIWSLFAPYHYLTAKLNTAARCFVAFVGDEPTSFAGVLRRPHYKAKDIMGVSRLVTLPDWQGLGLAFVLVDALGGAYKQVGERLRTYPAHPALMQGFDRSPNWTLKQKPSISSANTGINSTVGKDWSQGSRQCAVFEYKGPAWEDRAEATAFMQEAHAYLSDVWTRVAR